MAFASASSADSSADFNGAESPSAASRTTTRRFPPPNDIASNSSASRAGVSLTIAPESSATPKGVTQIVYNLVGQGQRALPCQSCIWSINQNRPDGRVRLRNETIHATGGDLHRAGPPESRCWLRDRKIASRSTIPSATSLAPRLRASLSAARVDKIREQDIVAVHGPNRTRHQLQTVTILFQKRNSRRS